MEQANKYLKFYFIFGLAIAAGLIWRAVFYYESHNNLLVNFFDVGQGDAIFLESPKGSQVLIDGGPGAQVLTRLSDVMPFWDRSIDLLILTHPDNDHIAGLVEVLKKYDVDFVVWTGVLHTSFQYEEWKRLLEEHNIPVFFIKAGERIYIGDEIFFDVLSPFGDISSKTAEKVNNTSIVGKLQHGNNSFLLMGDSEKIVERRLIFEYGEFLDSDVLKVGHHGSKTSTSEEFLSKVTPDIAVIQAGRNNRYGHPHKEVLESLTKFGVRVLRNDMSGNIIIESDGLKLLVKK